MDWDDAEAAIRSHVETQWAAGAFAAIPLVWENEMISRAASWVAISIEGTYADKSIYGSSGKRISVEGGLVFFHAFVGVGTTKATATAMVVALTAILELQTISTSILMEGGNPPSPAEPGDVAVPGGQPGGNFYRVSGSVPFIVTGAR